MQKKTKVILMEFTTVEINLGCYIENSKAKTLALTLLLTHTTYPFYRGEEPNTSSKI